MSKEIKKPETEVERHGVCDHEIKELREEVEEKDGIISLLREEVEEEYEKVARILKKNKSLETEVVRLNDIVGEQNRTILSDKTLIKSLRTTLEALRSDAKASQDLHARTLHKAEYLEQCLELRASDAEDLQICLDRRDAELAEAKEQIESLRKRRQYAVNYLGKIKTLQRQIEKLEGVIEECPPCRDKVVRDLKDEGY